MDYRAIAAGAVVGALATLAATVLPLPVPVALLVVFVPGLVAGWTTRDHSEAWLDGAGAGFVTAPLVGVAYFLTYGRVLLATSLAGANPPTPLTGGVGAFLALFLYGFLFFPAFTIPGAGVAHALSVYSRVCNSSQPA